MTPKGIRGSGRSRNLFHFGTACLLPWSVPTIVKNDRGGKQAPPVRAGCWVIVAHGRSWSLMVAHGRWGCLHGTAPGGRVMQIAVQVYCRAKLCEGVGSSPITYITIFSSGESTMDVEVKHGET